MKQRRSTIRFTGQAADDVFRALAGLPPAKVQAEGAAAEPCPSSATGSARPLAAEMKQATNGSVVQRDKAVRAALHELRYKLELVIGDMDESNHESMWSRELKEVERILNDVEDYFDVASEKQPDAAPSGQQAVSLNAELCGGESASRPHQ